MPLFFQLGYVCRALDPAIAAMTGQGAGDFLVIDVAAQMGVAEAPVKRIALAYMADVMIEIIEVDPAAESVFRDALSDGPLQLHHLGYLVDTKAQWAAIGADARRAGMTVTADEIPGVMCYSYVDRRADLGHFNEYVQLDEGGRALFAGVPSGLLLLDSKIPR